MSEGTIAVVTMMVTSLFFVALGVWYVGRSKISVEDFIVSRNVAGTGLATATLVASALGAWILFAPAETGANFGVSSLVGYGLGSAAPLLAFIVLGARMRRLMPDGHSITEFVWYRYGAPMYFFTIAVVIFYMFVFLSAELTGIAQAVKLIGDTPLALTAIVVGILTVAYTAYGGMRASLFTDRIQFFIIIPLLIVIVIAAIVAVDGIGDVLDKVSDTKPELLSPTHGGGIEFGITLMIAILAAEMFNQGSWQRVYTMRDEGTLRKGFLIAGIVVLPVIFVTGLFGIMAVGMDAADNPSVAMISFVKEVMPFWSVVALLVLGIVLVMSSMDTLLNGIVSAVTTDLTRFKPEMGSASVLTLVARRHRRAHHSRDLHRVAGLQRLIPISGSRPRVRRGHLPCVLRAVFQEPHRDRRAGQQRCRPDRGRSVLPHVQLRGMELHTGIRAHGHQLRVRRGSVDGDSRRVHASIDAQRGLHVRLRPSQGASPAHRLAFGLANSLRVDRTQPIRGGVPDLSSRTPRIPDI